MPRLPFPSSWIIPRILVPLLGSLLTLVLLNGSSRAEAPAPPHCFLSQSAQRGGAVLDPHG